MAADQSPLMMKQYAPYPALLAELVIDLHYRNWRIWLEELERDQAAEGHAGAGGLTLIVQRRGPDSYHPERTLKVNHYFPVPAATYDLRSWRRWLFDRLGDVDTHERMEDFVIGGVRPYAPSHGPGNDPYMIRELGTAQDQRTSFRGVLDRDGSFPDIDGV